VFGFSQKREPGGLAYRGPIRESVVSAKKGITKNQKRGNEKGKWIDREGQTIPGIKWVAGKWG